jgi:hypothetical protein
VSGDGGSFAHVSCHFGADWRVRCSVYPDTTPILSLDAGPSAAVSVTTAGKGASKAAVEFARALVREAQKFADEIERMHAAQLDGDGKAAGRDAA